MSKSILICVFLLIVSVAAMAQTETVTDSLFLPKQHLMGAPSELRNINNQDNFFPKTLKVESLLENDTLQSANLFPFVRSLMKLKLPALSREESFVFEFNLNTAKVAGKYPYGKVPPKSTWGTIRKGVRIQLEVPPQEKRRRAYERAKATYEARIRGW